MPKVVCNNDAIKLRIDSLRSIIENIDKASEAEVIAARKWFDKQGISYRVDNGYIELLVNKEPYRLSRAEVAYRAGLFLKEEVRCDDCGMEVKPDENGNCPNCGTLAGE